jgi:hypothetical protein
MGAPVGNTNRLKHGQRSKRSPWTLAKLKDGNESTLRRVYRARREVRAVVVDHRGVLGTYEECKINEACEWELAKRDIADYFDRHRDTFTPEQFLAYRLAIPKAAADRNKCLEKLGLDKPMANDVWAGVFDAPALPSPQPTNDGDQSSRAANDALDAKPSDGDQP